MSSLPVTSPLMQIPLLTRLERALGTTGSMTWGFGGGATTGVGGVTTTFCGDGDTLGSSCLRHIISSSESVSVGALRWVPRDTARGAKYSTPSSRMAMGKEVRKGTGGFV